MREPEIIYQDQELLVVSKPAGLPTTSPGDGDCLVRRVTAMDPRAPHLHASSRLDAEVTGLVTFARTREANRRLLDARSRGVYRRTYLSLHSVAPEASEGEWRWAIGMDPADKRRRRALESGDSRGKPSLTRYRLLATAGAGVVMALFPQSGRTHQLRVHALAAGVPILGDRHYGGEARIVLPNGLVVRPERVMLHCAALELPGRHHSEPLLLSAPVPEDMLRAWSQLGGRDGELAAPAPQASSDSAVSADGASLADSSDPSSPSG